MLQALSVLRPNSRQAPIPCALPRRKPELGQELGQGTWTNFITCFPLTEPLVQVRGKLGQGTWTTAGCRVTSSLSIPPRFQAGPDSVCLAPAETRTWTRTWTRNLDKFYHVFFKFARETWTRNCGLPCYKLSYYAPIPGRPRFQLCRPGRKPEQLRAAVLQVFALISGRPDSVCLPALVRPAFDLVLRRIQSLKRCVQACGCKIMTPRYAPQFGSRLHFKQCQPLPKNPLFFFLPFFGPLFF